MIEECLTRYPGPGEVCISFNGGKDCSVLLHLVVAAWRKRKMKHRLKAVYIRGLDPFPEMEQFVEDTRQRFAAVFNCLEIFRPDFFFFLFV